MRVLSSTPAALLEIDGLRVRFRGDGGRETVAVDDVGFSLSPGRTLGIVGESGSGKSVTALALMRLLDPRSAIVSGSIRFEGQDLLDLPAHAMRDLRGNRIAMIFQEPMTSLNPAYTVGEQLVEALQRHRKLSDREARDAAIAMLAKVRIPSPERRFHDYPHRLSGGQRQRVMIAMALSCDPQLLIADEPTTALDVTIQAQILSLMADLRRETDAAILLITHDLGVVAESCDDVVVMYAGQVVEKAPVAELFAFPQHPYTVGLLGSLPRFDVQTARLPAIAGSVPAPGAMPPGCRFANRCPFAIARCAEPPPLVAISPGRETRCWRAPLETLVAA
jgi:peptide/nickel transport system ATP-binding protein